LPESAVRLGPRVEDVARTEAAAFGRGKGARRKRDAIVFSAVAATAAAFARDASRNAAARCAGAKAPALGGRPSTRRNEPAPELAQIVDIQLRFLDHGEVPAARRHCVLHEIGP